MSKFNPYALLLPLKGKTPANKGPRTSHPRYGAYQQERWLEKSPDHALGWDVSEDIIVFDYDNKTETPWLELRRSMPPTFTVTTRNGGYHDYYRLPRTDKHLTVRKPADDPRFVNMDLKKHGDYVCAPPSPGYTITNDVEPAPLPIDIYAIITRENKPQVKQNRQPYNPDFLINALRKLDQTAYHGKRDEWMNLQRALYVASGGDDEVGEAFTAWMHDKPDPESVRSKLCVQQWWDDMRTNPPTQIGVGTLVHEMRKQIPDFTLPDRVLSKRERLLQKYRLRYRDQTYSFLYFQTNEHVADTPEYENANAICASLREDLGLPPRDYPADPVSMIEEVYKLVKHKESVKALWWTQTAPNQEGLEYQPRHIEYLSLAAMETILDRVETFEHVTETINPEDLAEGLIDAFKSSRAKYTALCLKQKLTSTIQDALNQVTNAEQITQIMQKAPAVTKFVKNKPAPMSAIFQTTSKTYEGVRLDFNNEYPDYISTWRGFAIRPEHNRMSGVVEEYVRNVLANEHPEGGEYILNWLAFLFQRPSERHQVALAFVGRGGTGKSRLMDGVIRPILQNAAVSVSHESVFKGFNDILDERVCVNINEARISLPSEIDTFKTLITDDTITFNKKGIGAYNRQNHISFILTANDSALSVFPIAYDADGAMARRIAMFRVSDRRKGQREYFERLCCVPSLQAFLHECLRRDISNFNPEKDIPETPASKAWKRSARGNAIKTLARLQPYDPAVRSVQELYYAVKQDYPYVKMGPAGIVQELTTAGISVQGDVITPPPAGEGFYDCEL